MHRHLVRSRGRRLLSEALESRHHLHGGFVDVAFGNAGTLDVPAAGLTTAAGASASQTFGQYPNALLATADGGMVAATTRHDYKSDNVALLTRYTASNVLDPNFGNGGQANLGDVHPLRLYMLPTGDLLVVGSRVDTYGGFVRLTANGQPIDLTAFQRLPFEASTPISSTQAADGSVYVLASSTYSPQAGGSVAIFHIAADGALDTAYGDAGRLTLPTAVAGGVTQLVALPSSGFLLRTPSLVKRIDAAGQGVVSFGADGAVTVASTGDLVPLPGGTFVFPQFVPGLTNRSRLQRLSALGQLTSFGPTQLTGLNSPELPPPQLAVANDGSIYASFKTFASVAGGNTDAIERLSPDGTRDASFGVNGLFVDTRYAPDATCLIAAADGSPRWLTGHLVTRTVNLSEEVEGITRLVAQSPIEINPVTNPAVVDEGTSFTVSTNPSLPAGVSMTKIEWSADVSADAFAVNATTPNFAVTNTPAPVKLPGVRLTLSDGTVVAQAFPYAVRNVAPVVTPVGPYNVLRGVSNSYALGVSYVVDPLNVVVNFGPGIVAASLPRTGGSASYTYLNSGTYHVTADVSDDATTVHQAFDVNVYDVIVSLSDSTFKGAFPTSIPLAGLPVTLDLDNDGVADPGEPRVLTDAGGKAGFDLHGWSGTYGTIIDAPPGYWVPSPPTAHTLAAGAAGQQWSYLVTRASSVALKVFDDANDDGVADSTALAARHSYYIDADNNGRPDVDEPFYSLAISALWTTLPAGTYTLRALPVIGGGSPNGTLPSIPITILDHPSAITLPDLLVRDARVAVVNVRIFNDVNSNGVQDTGETSSVNLLSNAPAFEDANGNGMFDPGLESVLTNASGPIPNLPSGHVTIRVAPRAWETLTTAPAVAVDLTNAMTTSGAAPTVTFGIHRNTPQPTTPIAVLGMTLDTTHRAPTLVVQFSDVPIFNSSILDLLVNSPSGKRFNAFDGSSSIPYRVVDPVRRTAQYAIDPAKFAEDGVYTVTLSAGVSSPVNITSVMFIGIARLIHGDANNDGVVDFNDLLTLARNYGTSGHTFSEGNFDGDILGNVDFTDLLMLAKNYGVSYAPAGATPFTSAATTPTRTRHGTAADVLA